jgi:uncharacterized protein (TIGR02217 family)
MAFLETPRFPENIQFGFTGGPEYNTTVVTVGSGYEQRNRNWAEARGKWTAEHGPHNKATTDTLVAFFRSVAGRAHGFRFKDWGDFEVTTANGVVELLTTTTFQLQKKYVTGSLVEFRDIKKPVAGTVKVYEDGVLRTSGYTLNTTTGVLTFTVAPTGLITWEGQFDVPVRFDTDKLELQITDGMNYVWGNIEIMEIRV